MKPWHGVLVATALPLADDLSVDFDLFADHIRWLAENGCNGATPNGSLRPLNGTVTCWGRNDDGELGTEHEAASFKDLYRALAVFRPVPRR